MAINFKLIKVNNDKEANKKQKKNISLKEFDNLTDKERQKYLKEAKLNTGYRIEIIKSILKFFEFEIRDNMIDISFLYNLSDKDLCILQDILFNNCENFRKE